MEQTNEGIVLEMPVPKGKRRVKNWTIADIHAALSALSQRRLTERKNQKKIVDALVDHFDAPSKKYQDARNKVIEERPAPEGWEGTELPIVIAEGRMIELNKLAEETQDILDVPKELLIMDSDLPKLMQGELGDANQTGIGDIIHKLHWMYGERKIKESVKDGEDGATPLKEE